MMLPPSLYFKCECHGVLRNRLAVKYHSLLVGSEESVDTYSIRFSYSHLLVGYDWGPSSIGGELQEKNTLGNSNLNEILLMLTSFLDLIQQFMVFFSIFTVICMRL